ncbi:MAG: hypothetical protein ACLVL7_07550 [Anaerotruncus massiliensis (ex Togo et al. 2019)]
MQAGRGRSAAPTARRRSRHGHQPRENLGFTYEYTVDDADGDELTVTEQLNGDTLRTINNAPKKETLSLTIDAEKLYSA